MRQAAAADHEAIGVVAGFDAVAVVGEPVEQCSGELGVDEDVGPPGCSCR